MVRLAQKILTVPGKYTTTQKIAKMYTWIRRPDRATIDAVMQELSNSHLGIFVVQLGFVKYQQPEPEDLLKYQVNLEFYNERYNTPTLPSKLMTAVTMQHLDAVAISMPAKPPGKVCSPHSVTF